VNPRGSAQACRATDALVANAFGRDVSLTFSSFNQKEVGSFYQKLNSKPTLDLEIRASSCAEGAQPASRYLPPPNGLTGKVFSLRRYRGKNWLTAWGRPSTHGAFAIVRSETIARTNLLTEMSAGV
jgi:hypothetical protein